MGHSPLVVRDLSVAYQKSPFCSMFLEVPEGKLIGIIGPNGAGKSTLIKATLGLIPKLRGEVLVYGKPYKQQLLKVGYVPQRESVDWDFPTNALDVVLMGRYGRLGWFKRPGAADRQAAMESLDKVE